MQGGDADDGSAGALLEQLTGRLESARAADSAAQIIVTDEAEDDLDLDKLDAEVHAALQANERIARWTQPS